MKIHAFFMLPLLITAGTTHAAAVQFPTAVAQTDLGAFETLPSPFKDSLLNIAQWLPETAVANWMCAARCFYQVLQPELRTRLIKYWSNEPIEVVTLKKRILRALTFSPVDKHLLAGYALCRNERILCDDEAAIIIKKAIPNSGSIWSLVFSPDGTRVASASSDKLVRLWNVMTDQSQEFKGHFHDVTSVAFLFGNRQLVSGSCDNTIRWWNIKTGREMRHIVAHSKQINCVACSPNNQWIASGSADQTIKLWVASTGAFIKQLSGHFGPVHSVAFSPTDNNLLAFASEQQTGLWDLEQEKMKQIETIDGTNNGFHSVVFSPEGSLVASYTKGNYIILWNVQAGEIIRFLIIPKGCYPKGSFSRDGKRLLAGCTGGENYIFDVQTRQ